MIGILHSNLYINNIIVINNVNDIAIDINVVLKYL